MESQGKMPSNSSLSQAINHLGFELYKELSKGENNFFFSPLSLSCALAMAFSGAQHETSSEMHKVLGYESANIQDDEVKDLYKVLLSTLEETPESYTLNAANVVFTQQDFQVKEDFKYVLEEFFKALILEVDFSDDPDKCVKQANEWVSTKTNGMISNLLESLDPSTVMVILNAVYFKGFWMQKFKEKDTFLQCFYNEGIEDNAKQVEMMHLEGPFPYAEKESFKAIQLPYRCDAIEFPCRDGLSMLILLPNARDGMPELEGQISTEFVHQLISEMRKPRKTKVEVALPKFRLEYSKCMKDIFQNLGMNRAFNAGARFGGISDSENIYISDIIHKAVIEVNEEGTVAAAVTLGRLDVKSVPVYKKFIADHPFSFMIYNSIIDTILFFGKVNRL